MYKRVGMFVVLALATVGVVGLLACPPPPVPAEPDAVVIDVRELDAVAPQEAAPSASEADAVADQGARAAADAGLDFDAACANLRALGCAEGFGVDGGKPCSDRLAFLVNGHLAPINAGALIDAGSKAAVRGAGVACK